jgi:hypothetical protein
MPQDFLPTYEEWKLLTEKKVLGGKVKLASPEWKNLNKAFKQYEKDRGVAKFKNDLIRALVEFDEIKKEKYGSKPHFSERDSKAALTALRKYLTLSPPEFTEEDIKAFRELNWAESNAIRRTLTNARIRYKGGSGREMATSLASSTNEFLQVAYEAYQPADIKKIVENYTQVKSNLEDKFRAVFQKIFDLAEEFKYEAMQELTKVIGHHAMSEIQRGIPIYGDVKDVLDVVSKINDIIENERLKKRITTQQEFTRPGDVAVAIQGIQNILASRRIDLGLELVSSSVNLAVGFGTFGTGGRIASAATSFAKLIKVIIDFLHEFVQIKRANKALEKVNGDAGDTILITEVINKFPFLGAHLIATVELNTLLQMQGISMNNPWFVSMTWVYRQRIEDIKETAYSIVRDSRLEVVQLERVDMALLQVREVFFKNLEVDLKDEIARRNNSRLQNQPGFESHQQKMTSVFSQLGDAVKEREARVTQRAADLASHKHKMASVFGEMKAAVKNHDDLVAEKEETMKKMRGFLLSEITAEINRRDMRATTLELMIAMNDENEKELARLIDIRKLKLEEENENTNLILLQKNIQGALAAYKNQTTGFNKFITKQSSESTAAIAEMLPLVASVSVEDRKRLKHLVEFLLRKPGAISPPAPSKVARPLNQPSRLFDLLGPAYKAVYQ